jgi:N-dimethylarginine dimethylaminohydrolase
VLVQRPGAAFGAAFEDPANGFLHRVDLELARREHDAFSGLLARLGVRVHELGAAATPHPDLVYAFDPLLVTHRGAIPLRSGKPGRRGEEVEVEGWLAARGVPTVGRIAAPGTVDGGDTFWLRPDLFCAGRTLRTNGEGVRQLAALVGGDVRVFDVPYWRGDAELVHLLSVVSPVADDLAVVYLPLLPVGLWELLRDLGIAMLPVPDQEFPTLGCNVLAVRPGVCVVADGNPATRRSLEAAGCEVHAYPASEIGMNGSGGPACMARPLLRRA